MFTLIALLGSLSFLNSSVCLLFYYSVVSLVAALVAALPPPFLSLALILFTLDFIRYRFLASVAFFYAKLHHDAESDIDHVLHMANNPLYPGGHLTVTFDIH